MISIKTLTNMIKILKIIYFNTKFFPVQAFDQDRCRALQTQRLFIVLMATDISVDTPNLGRCMDGLVSVRS